MQFFAHRLVNSKVIWSNGVPGSEILPDERAAILEQFSYVVQNGETFDNLSIDIFKKKIFDAERYGGDGISDNGGGVRVGVTGDFQIKGIGKNPLVGNIQQLLHSYGGLTAAEAIYEKIYTEIANLILPYGAKSISTIILTGPDGAYPKKTTFIDDGNSKRRVWGALAVRQNSLRLGHFVRAPHFDPAIGAQNLASDLARTRSVNKSFFRHCGTYDKFIEQISLAVARHAQQFAASRAATLAHGALTSSNLCMDGAWIDLPRATFVPSNLNLGGIDLVPSWQEPMHCNRLLKEVLHSLRKYNKLEFQLSQLDSYFEHKFAAAMVDNIGFILGIDDQVVRELPRSTWVVIANHLGIILNKPRIRQYGLIDQVPDIDPLCSFSSSLYESIHSPATARKKISQLLNTDESAASSILCSFRNIVHSVDNIFLAAGSKFSSIHCYIKSKKRSILRDFFQKKRLEGRLERCLEMAPWQDCEKALTSHLACVTWIFSKEYGDREIIYSDTRNTIYYENGNVVLNTGVHVTPVSYDELENTISHQNLVIEGYDFSIYTKRTILGVFKMLEGLSHRVVGN
jgi:hypothetical protein